MLLVHYFVAYSRNRDDLLLQSCVAAPASSDLTTTNRQTNILDQHVSDRSCLCAAICDLISSDASQNRLLSSRFKSTHSGRLGSFARPEHEWRSTHKARCPRATHLRPASWISGQCRLMRLAASLLGMLFGIWQWARIGMGDGRLYMDFGKHGIDSLL